MIAPYLTLILISVVFAICIAAVFCFKTQRTIMIIPVFSSLTVSLLTVFWGAKLYNDGTFIFGRGNIIIDSLSFFHIALVNIVFTATSAYMIDYFTKITKDDFKSIAYFRRFFSLWQAFHAMLILVLISNNIGLTWIALESTTIVSSFLILSEKDTLSIEAMWKYLLICSVGIALAFIGTILVIAAAHSLPTEDSVYTFTELHSHASELDPALMLFSFIFLVVGFGTKAGLAPMHTWLPDAHSQAPTPVSAVFSGVMLNCALFTIMRYLSVMNSVDGIGVHAHSILLFFGLASLFVAVVFVPIQRDMKRLLAYCSVEHIGIIVIGLGLGGMGTVAALFHTLNHSLAKMLAFFSAGSIINQYKTRNMEKIRGVINTMPIWGGSFIIAMFALLGIAPSSVFLSEFMIAKSAFSSGRYIILGFFMLGALVIFMAILKYVLDLMYAPPNKCIKKNNKVSWWNKISITICIAEFIIFGLWIPGPFMHFLKNAASIIENGNVFK